MRILDRICQHRGYPDIIRTDNGQEFTGHAMLEWADECLNEHWFFNRRHARRLIEAWQKEYNEERPKKGLGGLTPVHQARRLARKSITVTASL